MNFQWANLQILYVDILNFDNLIEAILHVDKTTRLSDDSINDIVVDPKCGKPGLEGVQIAMIRKK